jgi:hypothetical protein
MSNAEVPISNQGQGTNVQLRNPTSERSITRQRLALDFDICHCFVPAKADLLFFPFFQKPDGTCVAAEMVGFPVYRFLNGFPTGDIHLALRILNHLVNDTAVLRARNPVFRADDPLQDSVSHISEHEIDDETHEPSP